MLPAFLKSAELTLDLPARLRATRILNIRMILIEEKLISKTSKKAR